MLSRCPRLCLVRERASGSRVEFDKETTSGSETSSYKRMIPQIYADYGDGGEKCLVAQSGGRLAFEGTPQVLVGHVTRRGKDWHCDMGRQEEAQYQSEGHRRGADGSQMQWARHESRL
jgi:hypothetical protein